MAFHQMIQSYEFARSIPRSIDDETLLDILRIVEFEAERVRLLEEAGFVDQLCTSEVLYQYLLDSLGVPESGISTTKKGDHPAFKKECAFSRQWFEELFFSEYLLNNKDHNWDYKDVLSMIREEVSNNLERHFK